MQAINKTGAMSSLSNAVEKGNAIAVSRLLKNNNNPLPNPGTKPLLHIAVTAPSNCWIIVRMLIEAGVPIWETDQAGATALHVAADHGHVKCLQELLQLGAKVSQGDKDGRIPLHYATRNHSGNGIKCLESLIEAGSVIDAPAKHGYTPLHVAAEIGNATAVKKLLKAGASHGLTDINGRSPLHLVSTPSVTEILLNAGAEGRALDINKETVLQHAIKHHHGIVRKFLDAGTSIYGDNSGMRVFFHLHLLNGDKTEGSLLKDMVDYGHYDFLKHPLCDTFIHLKWVQVSILFYFKLLLYVTLVVILTTSSCLKKGCFHTEISSSETDSIITKWRAIAFLDMFAKLELAILLTFSAIQIVTLKMHFFYQIRKVMEVIFKIAAFILLLSDQVRGTWEPHAWVVVLLGGWCLLVALIGHLPAVGIYIQMFKKVSIRMLTFACVYSSLFIGFAVSFHLIFEGEVFNPLWMSGLKTLAMMVGELDFSSVLGGDTKPALPGTAQVIFVLFVLLMTIVITNLLVGLAVQDIQMLQKEAGVSRLALTVEQETSVDIMLSSRLISCIMPHRLHTWLRNKCSLLHHLPQRNLLVSNVSNQTTDSDTSVDWWIRRGTRSQQRGPMEHYNIFICPYNPTSPGKVYFSNSTKLIPTNYTLPDWIVRNTKLLIENGLHTKENDMDVLTDDGEEDIEELDTTEENPGITLENLQEQLNELQKSVNSMSQMVKKIMHTK